MLFLLKQFAAKNNTQFINKEQPLRCAITVGTTFMQTTVPRAFLQFNHQITLDDSSHSGEGESKIFSKLTQIPASSNLVIHGLDADILLHAIASDSIYAKSQQFCSIQFYCPTPVSTRNGQVSSSVGNVSNYSVISINELHKYFTMQFNQNARLGTVCVFNATEITLNSLLARLDFTLLILLQNEDYGPCLHASHSHTWNHYSQNKKKQETIVLQFSEDEFELNIPFLYHLFITSDSSNSCYDSSAQKDNMVGLQTELVIEYCAFLYWLLYMMVYNGKCLNYRYIYPFGGNSPSLRTILTVYQLHVCCVCFSSEFVGIMF